MHYAVLCPAGVLLPDAGECAVRIIAEKRECIKIERQEESPAGLVVGMRGGRTVDAMALQAVAWPRGVAAFVIQLGTSGQESDIVEGT